jgi:Protein of unknown function (DUF3500)
MLSATFLAALLAAVPPDGKGFTPTPATHTELVQNMTAAVKSLAEVLPKEELQLALFNYGGKEHKFWHYVPTPLNNQNEIDKNLYKPYGRIGVPVEKMSQQAKDRLHHLLRTTLTFTGYQRYLQIMRLEDVGDPRLSLVGLGRSPTSGTPGGITWYHFSLFGNVGEKNWGWRFEGHHFSLSVEVKDGKVQFSPIVLGYNPWAQLPEANVQAAKLFSLLPADQQKKAQLVTTSPHKDIPRDIQRNPGTPAPVGVQLGKLSLDAQYAYNRFIDEFLGQFPDAMVEETRRTVQASSANAYFAWYGTFDHSKPYFVQLQGPTFLIQLRHNGVEGSGYIHGHVSYHALDVNTGSYP